MNDTQTLLIPSSPTTKIIKSGRLYKRSKYLKIWKNRFIVLTNKNIFAFTSDDKDSDCTMTLILKDCLKVETADEGLQKENTFSVTDDERTYYFQANSETERDQWMKAIESEITTKSA